MAARFSICRSSTPRPARLCVCAAGFGPCRWRASTGTLSWTLKSGEGCTNITLSYVVGGYIRSGMEQWAPQVDRVLDEQLQRLKSFVEGKAQTQ
jgi:hypothetical protein